MRNFNVVTDYRAGYFGGNHYVIAANSALEAEREAMQRERQAILDNPNIPDRIANTTTMTALARAI